MPDIRFLDQAIDPRGMYIEGTALSYDAYLLERWGDFGKWYPESWDRMYEEADVQLQRLIRSMTETYGCRLKDICVAIIGPGFHPVGKELRRNTVRGTLRDLGAFIVVDFSQRVVQSAMADLLEAGMSARNMYGMQYDITQGYSTVFAEILQEYMKGVETEDAFDTATERLARLTFGDIRERMIGIMARRGEEMQRGPSERLIGGGLNKERTLRPTVEGQLLAAHTAFSSCLTAFGTSAPAEASIVERYREVTSDENRGARPPGEETESTRCEMIRRVYQAVNMFNTGVFTRHVEQVLTDNPDAVMNVVGDVSTIFDDLRIGEVPRVDLPEVSAFCAQKGYKLVSELFEGHMREHDHRHPITNMRLRRLHSA